MDAHRSRVHLSIVCLHLLDLLPLLGVGWTGGLWDPIRSLIEARLSVGMYAILRP